MRSHGGIRIGKIRLVAGKIFKVTSELYIVAWEVFDLYRRGRPCYLWDKQIFIYGVNFFSIVRCIFHTLDIYALVLREILHRREGSIRRKPDLCCSCRYERWHPDDVYLRVGRKFKVYALHLFHGDFAWFLWHRRYQKVTEKHVVDRQPKLTNKLYIVSREQSLLMANYIASYLWINLYLCSGSRGCIMLP